MESVFNINPDNIQEIQIIENTTYSFLNDIFDIHYHRYYSLINSLEKYKIKNLYNFLFLRSLKLHKKKQTREMKINKYIDDYEILNQELTDYIQGEKLYAIIIMNGIQLFFFPNIN